MPSKAQQQRDEQEAARARLRELFPIGSEVSTVLLHASSSGMSRAVAVMAADEEGRVSNVSWLVARATGNKLHRTHDGVVMGGAGMDMGYALVYSLARALYADGFPCTGVEGGRNRCPSNDHSNERWSERDYTPGRLHSDPGYALTQRWI